MLSVVMACFSFHSSVLYNFILCYNYSLMNAIYNGPYVGVMLLQQHHCHVVHGLTPLLCSHFFHTCNIVVRIILIFSHIMLREQLCRFQLHSSCSYWGRQLDYGSTYTLGYYRTLIGSHNMPVKQNHQHTALLLPKFFNLVSVINRTCFRLVLA